MKNLPWIDEATAHLGLYEIPGPKTNPTLGLWLHNLKAWWTDDTTPWCGLFVAHCLQTAKRAIPKEWYRAKAYMGYGTPLKEPAYGCIAVKSRKGGGHVFFIVGKTASGDLVGLGGNQGNNVCYAKFKRSDIEYFCWPDQLNGSPSFPDSTRYVLPLFNNHLEVVSEA